MILLILGVLLWSAVHLLPVFSPALRQQVSDKIGLLPSKGLAAVLLILSVVLMVRGYGAVDAAVLWVAPDFLWHINNLLMLFAVFIFIAGSFKSVVRQKIRNPQLTGFKIWAVAHLLVNGDSASIALFGGLLAWAVVTVIGLKKRDGAGRTIPEATMPGLVIHVVAGIVVTVGVMMIHWKLAGVSPFPA